MKNILIAGAAIMTISSAQVFAARPKFPPMGPVNFRPPAAERRVLPNGLVVYLQQDKTLPVVHALAIVRSGRIHDPSSAIGLGDLTVSLLKDGGTARYKAEEIDRELEYLGASVEPSMQAEETRVRMFSLRKDFDRTFDIFTQVLTEPAFEPEKVKIKKEEALELIRRRNDDPAKAAQREAMRMFYGPGHPYGWRPELSTVSPLTAENMKAHHAAFFAPNNTILAISGAFESADEIMKAVEARLGGWRRKEVSIPVIPPVRVPESGRVYLVNKDISQVFVVMLMKGVKRHDPVEFPLSVMTEMLGGGIQSRLGNEIRSKRGLAYSVFSYFAKRPDHGFIAGSLGTKPESVAQAITLMKEQFGLLKTEEAPAEEVSRSRSQITNSFVFRFPTPFEIVAERASYEYFGYAPDYLDTYVDRMTAVTPGAMKEAAMKLYDTEKAVLYVIGNAAKFDKPLSGFGPVTELKED